MIHYISFAFISIFLLLSSSVNAQVGIGTITPDSSAVLELSSTDRGFLMPRLTSVQRDLINQPAIGLMIYNTTSAIIQVNNGNPDIPNWENMGGNVSSSILSIVDSGDTFTSSVVHEMIPGMQLTPEAGTYLVLFNGQYGLSESVPVSTAQGVIDLGEAYNSLMDTAFTNNTLSGTFVHGDVLLRGVYNIAGATSLPAGKLTMDGGGDTTSVFIIRSVGALNTTAGATVILTNGARARNIFWISQGAIGLGANTIMKGTLIANNMAVAAGAGSELEGRLFSTSGAIAFGPGTAFIPAGNSYIDLGVLSSFVMFTSSGAVGNTEPSFITGDVGTNLGAITGFEGEGFHGNIYGPGAAPEPINNTLVTFSVYVNDVLLANSTRTTDINTSVIALQAITTVGIGQSLDIRWHVDTGNVVIGNRILSLIPAH